MTGFEWLASSGLIAVAIVVIGILFVWRTIKDKKAGFPATDERTQRITGRAAMTALNSSIVAGPADRLISSAQARASSETRGCSASTRQSPSALIALT